MVLPAVVLMGEWLSGKLSGRFSVSVPSSGSVLL